MSQENDIASVRHVINSPDFRLTTALLWTRNGIVSSDKQEDEIDDKCTQEEPDLGLLPLHCDRLLAAVKAVGWPPIPGLESTTNDSLERIREQIDLHRQSLPKLEDGGDHVERRKMRILLSRDGTITIDSIPISITTTANMAQKLSRTPFLPSSLNFDSFGGKIATVFLDSCSTPLSIFTTHKTSHRPHYDAARKRANIGSALPTEKEVLLYNDADEVMEASLCTVYFNRNGDWMTPAARCGGNLGVTRRLAIETGLCQEGLVMVADLQHGENIWLSNAARGFFVGRVHLDRSLS